MKTLRNLIQLCRLAVALLALPAVGQAQIYTPTIVTADCNYLDYGSFLTVSRYFGTNGVFTIPSEILGLPVIRIEDSAFDGSTNLVSITIPNSIANIGTNAFRQCLALTNLVIGSGVTNISDTAFLYCSKLANVVIPGSVLNIGYRAFSGCNALTNLVLSDGIVSIGSQAFNGANNLGNLTIPGSVVTLTNSFSSCGSLTIMDGVRSIGNNAFYCINGPTNVSIPGSVTNIGDHAFDDYLLTNVSLTNGLVRIGTRGFSSARITNLVIPNTVTSIGDYSFWGCIMLTNIVLPNGLSSISSYAFASCTSLPTMFLPDSVTNIGTYSFQNCFQLATVTIPANLASIEYFAFSGCWSLTNFAVAPENRFYSSLDGVLLDKNRTTIIQYPYGKSGCYTVPDCVNRIGDLAFIGSWQGYSRVLNMNPTIVIIGSGVTNIGLEAFADCGLTAAYFLGDAPTCSLDAFGEPSVFYASPNVTVYYLSGTSGWGPTFGGAPTKLWLPQIQIVNNMFGVQSNQFSSNISWASGHTVVVEACTNLSNPAWQPVQTNTLTTGSAYFSDPQWTNYPGRFYRLRSP